MKTVSAHVELLGKVGCVNCNHVPDLISALKLVFLHGSLYRLTYFSKSLSRHLKDCSFWHLIVFQSAVDYCVMVLPVYALIGDEW